MKELFKKEEKTDVPYRSIKDYDVNQDIQNQYDNHGMDIIKDQSPCPIECKTTVMLKIFQLQDLQVLNLYLVLL